MSQVILFALVLVAVFGVGVELILRKRGMRPWKPIVSKIRYEPAGKFYAVDPLLGWRHLPGSFRIHLSDTFCFTSTHNSAGLRMTGPSNESLRGVRRRPQIWVFGCSHTHGWSVNDDQTYAWLLQAKMPQYEIVNFGVDGYGTVQSYLQCKRALENSGRPALVVLSWARFHEERNMFQRSWKKLVVPTNRLGPLSAPCARLDRTGKVVFKTSHLVYRPIPFMRHSSVAHQLDELFNRLQSRYYRSDVIATALLREFNALCARHGAAFVVAGIWSPGLDRLASFCSAEAIPFFDISVRTGSRYPEHHNWPHDPHPSPLAHQKYADGLYAHVSRLLHRNPLLLNQQDASVLTAVPERG